MISAASAADRARDRSLTETSVGRLTAGIAPGSALALVGQGTCGKVTLALRMAAGAQRLGATVLWVDGARSFDAVAALRAGVELRRAIVARPRSGAEVLLAASAGLRSEGFRLVVVDLGPAFAQVASIDSLAPVLPQVRGSTSALAVVADTPAMRLSIPTLTFERVTWETRHGRTVGWSYAVRRGDTAEREEALLHRAAV